MITLKLSTGGRWHVWLEDGHQCNIGTSEFVDDAPVIEIEELEPVVRGIPVCRHCLNGRHPRVPIDYTYKPVKGRPRKKRDGRSYTFRLLPEDFLLLRNLAQGGSGEISDRYLALRELVPIVKNLDRESMVPQHRLPLSIRIPAELDAAILELVNETGCTLTDAILTAAREYRRLNPID